MSMLRPIDDYFLEKEEPFKSCLQSLREYILRTDKDISEKMQYGMPFFYYRNKRICYLWIHKKLRQPYLGIVEGKKIHHPDLLREKRTKMKILLVDPVKDIPVNKIRKIVKELIALHN